MKRLLPGVTALFVCFTVLTTLPAFSQNIGTLPGKAKVAGAGLAITFENGKSTVIYQGAKVFEGATTQKAVGVVKNVNGVQYAAAFDGTKVIWENVKGASAKLK
jgi:hypothetical protein